ncbi:TauD/TfdA family dioxygenase [Sorangium sp. So ce363]
MHLDGARGVQRRRRASRAPLGKDERVLSAPEARQDEFEPPNELRRDRTGIYQRQYIESARRFPDVPPLSARQIEALDLFDALANDPALHMIMELRPGDIQLVHNHTLLHDRTAFEDWPDPDRKRHLLRLWLAPPGARPLPPVFRERYGALTPGDRGGIVVPGTRLHAPLDPA